MKSKLPQDYATFLGAMKARVAAAQVHAARAVNYDLVLLYWDVGAAILDKQETAGWGDAVVERFANDMRRAFPDMTGFSADNVWRMRQLVVESSTPEFIEEARQRFARLPFLEQLVPETQKRWMRKLLPSFQITLCAEFRELLPTAKRLAEVISEPHAESRMRRTIVVGLLWLISALLFGSTGVSEAADPDAVLSRMRELLSKYKSKDLTVEFEHEDFDSWPTSATAKAVEALQLRGRAYMVIKDGKRSEADFKHALKLAPKSSSTWLSLGENYFRNLESDAQALAAFEEVRKLTGPSKGWERLTATLFSVQLLTDDLKSDEALALLQQLGDPKDFAPIWRIRVLRAYGHVFAAQGKESESVSKFREALQVEAESQKAAK